MRIFLALLIILHGLIHLMGFAKAYQFAEMKQLSGPISRMEGLVWLSAAVLFITAAIMLIARSEYWWMAGGLAAIISQILVFQSWHDAKWGTLANIIILFAAIPAFLKYGPYGYRHQYRAEAITALSLQGETTLLSEADIKHLPEPVKRYIRYTGSIGKPRIQNFYVAFEGKMRNGLDAPWMNIHAQQVSTIHDPERIFYIESSMYGLPFDGLHLYKNGHANMQIKALSLIKVVNGQGRQMDQGETVTLFNDMCVIAPATLIDTNIKWQTIDDRTVKASFTNKEQTIAATLYFNEEGALINFISNDRFQSADGKTFNSYPWSTPLRDYKLYDGRKVASYGEAIWHTSKGNISYARFDMKEIRYNVKKEDMPL